MRLPEIKDLIRIQALKGASYSPAWGFSLDFVPHVSGKSVRWHRTVKTAQFDIRYDPIDYIPPFADGFSAWIITSFHGKRRVRKDIERVASKTVAQSERFFSKVGNQTDLVLLFEQQIAKEAVRFGFYNYPQQSLAYAFTLAKVGRSDDALSEFERFLSQYQVPSEAIARLHNLFNELLKQHVEDNA